VSELARAAASARSRLAAATSALDSPETALMLSRVALPLAQASGALFRIETEPGPRTPSDLDLARACIRTVLAALQDSDVQKAPIEHALGNVAACLGLTHEMADLSKQAPPPPMMPMQAGPAYHPSRPVSAVGPPRTLDSPVHGAAPYPDFSLESSRAPQPPRPPPAASVPQAQHTHPSNMPLSSTQNSPGVQKKVKAPNPALESTQVSRSHPDEREWDRAAAATTPNPRTARGAPGEKGFGPGGGSGTLPSAGHAGRAPGADPRWAAPTSRHAPGPPVPPEPGAARVEANLGAHSPTNFYKGLRGNDVVDHGGLFVATYESPGVGTSLWLRVTLPGGYSFDANAVVRWTRRQGTGDTPPGFGATFVSVSREARELVYRFTKNREPLFHDDI